MTKAANSGVSQSVKAASSVKPVSNSIVQNAAESAASNVQSAGNAIITNYGSAISSGIKLPADFYKNQIQRLADQGGVAAGFENIKSIGDVILSKFQVEDKTAAKSIVLPQVVKSTEPTKSLYSSGISQVISQLPKENLSKMIQQHADQGGVAASLENLKKIALTPIVKSSSPEQEQVIVEAIASGASTVNSVAEKALDKYSSTMSQILSQSSQEIRKSLFDLDANRENYLAQMKGDAISGITKISDLMKTQLAAAKDETEVEEIKTTGTSAIATITSAFEELQSKADSQNKDAKSYLYALGRYNSKLPEAYADYIKDLSEETKLDVLSNLADTIQSRFKDTTVLFGISPIASEPTTGPVQLSRGRVQGAEVHYTTDWNTANNVARALHGEGADGGNKVTPTTEIRIKEVLDQFKSPTLRASYKNLIETQGLRETDVVSIEDLSTVQREVLNSAAIGAARAMWDISASSMVTLDDDGKLYTPEIDRRPYETTSTGYKIMAEQGGEIGVDKKSTMNMIMSTITRVPSGDWARDPNQPLSVAIRDLVSATDSSYMTKLKSSAGYNPKDDTVDLSKLSVTELYQIAADTESKKAKDLGTKPPAVSLSTRDSVKTPYVIGGFESQTETDSLSGLGLETTKVGEKYTDINIQDLYQAGGIGAPMSAGFAQPILEGSGPLVAAPEKDTTPGANLIATDAFAGLFRNTESKFYDPDKFESIKNFGPDKILDPIDPITPGKKYGSAEDLAFRKSYGTYMIQTSGGKMFTDDKEAAIAGAKFINDNLGAHAEVVESSTGDKLLGLGGLGGSGAVESVAAQYKGGKLVSPAGQSTTRSSTSDVAELRSALPRYTPLPGDTPLQLSSLKSGQKPAEIHYTTDGNTSNNLSRALHGAEGAVTPTTKVSKSSLLNSIDPKARSQYESMFRTWEIPDKFSVADLTNEQRDIVNAAGIAGAQTKGLNPSATPTKDNQGNTFIPDPNSMGWTTKTDGSVHVLTSQGGTLQGAQGIARISARFGGGDVKSSFENIKSIGDTILSRFQPSDGAKTAVFDPSKLAQAMEARKDLGFDQNYIEGLIESSQLFKRPTVGVSAILYKDASGGPVSSISGVNKLFQPAYMYDPDEQEFKPSDLGRFNSETPPSEQQTNLSKLQSFANRNNLDSQGYDSENFNCDNFTKAFIKQASGAVDPVTRTAQFDKDNLRYGYVSWKDGTAHAAVLYKIGEQQFEKGSEPIYALYEPQTDTWLNTGDFGQDIDYVVVTKDVDSEGVGKDVTFVAPESVYLGKDTTYSARDFTEGIQVAPQSQLARSTTSPRITNYGSGIQLPTESLGKMIQQHADQGGVAASFERIKSIGSTITSRAQQPTSGNVAPAVQSIIQAYQRGAPGTTKTVFGWTDVGIADTPYEYKTFSQAVNEQRAAEGLDTGVTPYSLLRTSEETKWLDKYGEAVKSERREWSENDKYAVVTDIGTVYAPTLAEAQAAAQQIHDATGAHVEVKEDVLGTKLLGLNIAGVREFDRAPHAPTSKADQIQGRENADGTFTEAGTGLIYTKSGSIVGQTTEAAGRHATIDRDSAEAPEILKVTAQGGGAPVTSIGDLVRFYNPQSSILLQGLQASGASQEEAEKLATKLQVGKTEASPKGKALVDRVESKIAASEPQQGWLDRLKSSASQFYNQSVVGQLAYSTEQNQVRAGWTKVADDGKGILGGNYQLTSAGKREINDMTDGLISGKKLDEVLTTTEIPKIDQLKFWVDHTTPEDFVAAFKANPEMARDLTMKLPYSGKSIEAKLEAVDSSLVQDYAIAANAKYEGRSTVGDVAGTFGGIFGSIGNVLTEPLVSGSAGTGETAGKVQLAASPFMILGGAALKPVKVGTKLVKGAGTASKVDILKDIVKVADEYPELAKAVKTSRVYTIDNAVLDVADVPLSRTSTEKVATALKTGGATDKDIVDFGRHYAASTKIDSRVFEKGATKVTPQAIAVGRESLNYLDVTDSKKVLSALQKADPKMAEVFEVTRDYAAGIGGLPASKIKPLSTSAFENYLKAHPEEVRSFTPAQIVNSGYSPAKQEVLTNVWRDLNADVFKVTAMDNLPETVRPAFQKLLDGAEDTLTKTELDEVVRVVDELPTDAQDAFNKATIFVDSEKVGEIAETTSKVDEAAKIVERARDPDQAAALNQAFRAGDYEIPEVLARATDNVFTGEVATRVVKFQGVSGEALNTDTLRAIQVKSAQKVLQEGTPGDVYRLLSDGDFSKALADLPEDAFNFAVSHQPTTLGTDIRRVRDAAIKADARPEIIVARVSWDMATDAPAPSKIVTSAAPTADELARAVQKEADDVIAAKTTRLETVAKETGSTVDEVAKTLENYKVVDSEVKVAEKNLDAAQESLDLINKIRAVDDTPELAAKAATLEKEISSQQTTLKQAITKLTNNKAKMASVAGPVGKGQVKLDEVFKYAEDLGGSYRSPDEWSKFANEVSRVIKDDADVRAYLKTLSHTESDELARRLARTVGDGQAGARLARDTKLAHYESIIDEMKLDPSKWNRLSEADKSWAENLYLQGSFTDRDLTRFKKIAEIYDHNLAYRMFRGIFPGKALLEDPISVLSSPKGVAKGAFKIWVTTAGLGFIGFVLEEAFQTMVQFPTFGMDDTPLQQAEYFDSVLPRWIKMASAWDSTIGAVLNSDNPTIATIAAIMCPTGWAFDHYVTLDSDSAASSYILGKVNTLANEYGVWVMDGSNHGFGRPATEAELLATWQNDPAKFLKFASVDPTTATPYLDLRPVTVDGETRYVVGPNNLFLPGTELDLEHSDALLFHLFQGPMGQSALYKMTQVRDELQYAGVVDASRDEEAANKQYLEEVFARDLAHLMSSPSTAQPTQGAGVAINDDAVRDIAAKWGMTAEDARPIIETQVRTGAWKVAIDPETGLWGLERTAFTLEGIGGGGGGSGEDTVLSGSGEETTTKESYTTTGPGDESLTPPDELPAGSSYGEKDAWKKFKSGAKSINDVVDPYGTEGKALKAGLTLPDGSTNLNGAIQMFGSGASVETLKAIFGESSVLAGLDTLNPQNPAHAQFIQAMLNDPSLKYGVRGHLAEWSQNDPDKILAIPGLTDPKVRGFLGEEITGVAGIATGPFSLDDVTQYGAEYLVPYLAAGHPIALELVNNLPAEDAGEALNALAAWIRESGGDPFLMRNSLSPESQRLMDEYASDPSNFDVGVRVAEGELYWYDGTGKEHSAYIMQGDIGFRPDLGGQMTKVDGFKILSGNTVHTLSVNPQLYNQWVKDRLEGKTTMTWDEFKKLPGAYVKTGSYTYKDGAPPGSYDMTARDWELGGTDGVSPSDMVDQGLAALDSGGSSDTWRGFSGGRRYGGGSSWSSWEPDQTQTGLYVDAGGLNAEIYYGDLLIGYTDGDIIPMEPAEYKLTFKKAGYQSRTMVVMIYSTKTTSIYVKLYEGSDPVSMCDYITEIGGTGNLSYGHVCHLYALYRRWKYSAADIAEELDPAPGVIPTTITKDDMLFLIYLVVGDVTKAQALVDANKVCITQGGE